METKRDLAEMRQKIEAEFGTTNLHIWILKDGVFGHSMDDSDMEHYGDIINAKPNVLHISSNRKTAWFSFALPEMHDYPVVSTDWDDFQLSSEYTIDEIIKLIQELFKCNTAMDIYNVCVNSRLRGGYIDPSIDINRYTRRGMIDRYSASIDSVCHSIRQHTAQDLTPVLMTNIASFIEIIGRYSKLCENNHCPTEVEWQVQNRSKEFWTLGLPREFSRVLNDTQLDSLYKGFRCGLVHAGELATDIKIGTYIKTNLTASPVTINIIDFWYSIKTRWKEITVTPNIHPDGGIPSTTVITYGSDTNYFSKV